MTKNYIQLFSLLTLLLPTFASAQDVNIIFDATVQRYIGNVSELDRTKYFSIHDTGNDAEQSKLRTDYNVTGGRGFWGAFSFGKQKTGEVGVYPSPKTGDNSVRNVLEKYVATEHPKSAFKDGLDVNLAADWAVEYYKNYSTDSGRQEYFEIMNEPFVHASDFYSGGWNTSEEARIKLQMAQFYGKVGEKINASSALSKMKVIGYSSAWPSLEISDFGHWNDNMKMFMDTAGEHMYGFSTHLYDGINVTGQDSKRSGSNSEAILDLIENYSFIKWNTIKPHAITEYGAIEKGYDPNVYSEIASAQTLRSINHILFNLLDREDRLALSIPFITGKATWHLTAANNYQPYGATLWIPTNIGEPTVAGWKYSPRIHFYDLWKDVKGKRVLIKSDNPDIQSHAFLDGTKLYVALSNLDEANKTVKLSSISGYGNLTSVKIKTLKVYDFEMPNYKTETLTSAPSSITLIKDETVLLEYTFSKPIEFANTLRTKKYFTTNYLEAIKPNTTILYNFNNVTTGDGYAILRMSIGRKHNVSKKPIVKVNGTTVEVPINWQGYDQANRDDFFGMIEIPFSAQLLKTNNSVSIEFPDNGGRISSLILDVELFDTSQNKFSLKSIGNSCPNVSKGELIITPLISDSYSVLITGEGLNKTYNFTNEFAIKDLASGLYSIVITSATKPELRFEYAIEIVSPANLTVASKVNMEQKKVVLNLSGASNYSIKVNDSNFSTSNSTIEIPLLNGKNAIEVLTDIECQGIYKEEILIGNEITAYPNPVKNILNIDVGLDKSKTAEIEIYSTLGALIYAKNHQITNGAIQLTTSFLNNGSYILSIKTLNSQKNKVLIKY